MTDPSAVNETRTAANPDASPAAKGEADREDLGKLQADRRRKLERLRDEFGEHVQPFGHRVDGLLSLADAHTAYDPGADKAWQDAEADAKQAGGAVAIEDPRPAVRVAGRIVAHREMGNLIFIKLRDDSGELQINLSKKVIGQPWFSIAKLAELSDIAVATGRMGTTKKGEVSVWVQSVPEPAGSEDGDAGDGDTSRQRAAQPPFTIACKTLAPPPGKYHGLNDRETRYRKRYIDLYANPQVMATARMRIQIIEAIRDYMKQRGFMEVETPMLQPIHGGAAAKPFVTHHNALDMPLYLRIAPELYLKRLLVGGMRKVFEINRNFRNEGLSPRHNPEFTMLEAYEAFGNWETMSELVEDLICTVAEQVCGTLVIEHGPADAAQAASEPGSVGEGGGEEKPRGAGQPTRTIDLRGPESNRHKPRGQRWPRVPMADLVEQRTGWKFNKQPLSFDNDNETQLIAMLVGIAVVAERFKDKGVVGPDDIPARHAGESEQDYLVRVFGQVGAPLAQERADKEIDRLFALSPAEQLVEVYEKLVEPNLIDPCYVTRVPSVIIPLARECEDDPYFADVYELAINGVEISPGYTELNDPDVQEKHFRHQVGDREEQQAIDEDFLEALRVGMPPAGGIGLGIDRLVMMLTGATSIRDVILFPLMRPEGVGGGGG